MADRSRAQLNPGRTLGDVLAEGDVSAWLGLWPERLPLEEVLGAWERALAGSRRAIEVYAHFAFCRSSCHFCQYWHVVPRDGAEVDAFVDRSVATLRRYRERLGRVTAAHAYFGGGTPTALSAPQLDRFLSAFGETFRVEGDFTCEGHPATLDEDKIALLARAGVNRLSMGVQSLDPAVLKAIGRVNPPLPRIAALVACAQRLGVSVNLDLVLGLPEQSPASFRHDLEALLPARADSVIVYRYLPVERLPHEIPASMRYSAVVDASIVRAALARGYLPSLPGGDEDTGFGLRRPTRRVLRSFVPWARGYLGHLAGAPGAHAEYTLGEASDTHLFGLGPGAISHVFGWAWFRDATTVAAGRGGGEPELVGTRLTPDDELRTALLLALRRGGWTSLSALARRTGVDPRTALGAELDAAVASGALGRFSDFVRADPRAPGAAAFRRSLVPRRPEGTERRRRALEIIELKASDRIDPRLVELDAALRDVVDTGPKEASAALRAWCALVGIGTPGAALCDAKVERVDPQEVSFRVLARPAPALRVSVEAPGAGPSFGRSARFALSYAGGAGRVLAPEERRFLERLLDRTRDAERGIVP